MSLTCWGVTTADGKRNREEKTNLSRRLAFIFVIVFLQHLTVLNNAVWNKCDLLKNTLNTTWPSLKF